MVKNTILELPNISIFFHDQWKPVHEDSKWSPSLTLSMHHMLLLSSVMSSLCTERAAGKRSWPHTLHLNTVSRSPRTRMQGPLQIQRTIRLTVRSVNDNSQRGSLQTAGLGFRFTNDITERKQISGFSHYHCNWNSRTKQEDKLSKLCSNILFFFFFGETCKQIWQVIQRRHD